MTDDPLGDVAFLLDKKAKPDLIIDILSDPRQSEIAWMQSGVGHFIDKIHHIRKILDIDPLLKSLFNSFLISGYLLGRKYRAEDPQISQIIDLEIDQLFPGFNRENLLAARWASVPVLLVNHEKKAFVRYFLISVDIVTKKYWPEWAASVLDGPARNAIADAAAAVDIHLNGRRNINGFFCFPLVPNERRPIITGRSLALPLALGFLNLILEEPCRKEIISTGDLDCSGEILEVSLAGKPDLAVKKGFTVFLYPSGCALPSDREGMHMLPVTSLVDARRIAAFYIPEYKDKIYLFSQMLKSADRLIDNLADIPLDWIERAISSGECDAVRDELFSSTECLKRLSGRLERELMDQNRPHADKRILASLIPVEAMEGIGEKSPRASLQICALQIMLANHQGDINTAAQWRQIGDRIVTVAKKVGPLEPILDYVNHCLISRHNVYRFSPELPEWVTEILEITETQYDAGCRSGCEVHEPLGRMYGTLSQHFAFCGTDQFGSFEKYHHLALKALGAGIGPEFQPEEWKRQLNYRVYACLDSGMFTDAELTLKRYLAVDDWKSLSALLPDFSEWQLAVLCRFMADAGSDRLLEMISGPLFATYNPKRPHQHPWQLVTLNLGRIALRTGENEKSADYFKQSLERCLGTVEGPTVRAMALLPLAGLNMISADKEEVFHAYAEVKKTVLELNPDHFKMLASNDPKEILTRIWTHPETLFPFTYR